MDAKLATDVEPLYQTATRLQRVGLIVDRRALSPAHRRAAFALQCLAAQGADREPARPPIGFAYPTARGSAHPSPTTLSQESGRREHLQIGSGSKEVGDKGRSGQDVLEVVEQKQNRSRR